jgi:hypothetical protein
MGRNDVYAVLRGHGVRATVAWWFAGEASQFAGGVTESELALWVDRCGLRRRVALPHYA